MSAAKQLELATVGQLVARLAREGRQRILDGVVDATGRHRPEGPRKQLTPAQQRAHDAERVEGER